MVASNFVTASTACGREIWFIVIVVGTTFVSLMDADNHFLLEIERHLFLNHGGLKHVSNFNAEEVGDDVVDSFEVPVGF